MNRVLLVLACALGAGCLGGGEPPAPAPVYIESIVAADWVLCCSQQGVGRFDQRGEGDYDFVEYRSWPIPNRAQQMVYAPPLGETTLRLANVGCATGSMEPTIRCGDVVVLFPFTYLSALEIGAIVVYDTPVRKDGSSCAPDVPQIVHRVVAIDLDAQEVRTKGDANAVEDPCPVPAANIREVLVATLYGVAP